MEASQRPLHYFNVTFAILRNGQPYGFGNMKTENIDPRERGLNIVRSTVVQKLHEMQNGFTYELVRVVGNKITKEEYEDLRDDMTFD